MRTQEDYDYLHQIIPNLYLGGIQAGWNPFILEAYNIQAVLQILPTEPPSTVEHIDRLVVPIEDDSGENIKYIFNQSFYWIESQLNANRKVLVHCFAGVSRSATIVIAYLMRKFSWEYEKALEYVQEKRKCIDPNIGFLQQLQQYEIELFS